MRLIARSWDPRSRMWAKYRGEVGIEGRLVDKLKRGSSGVWGPLPMPPNPDLAEQDARALIEWILGQGV